MQVEKELVCKSRASTMVDSLGGFQYWGGAAVASRMGAGVQKLGIKRGRSVMGGGAVVASRKGAGMQKLGIKHGRMGGCWLQQWGGVLLLHVQKLGKF